MTPALKLKWGSFFYVKLYYMFNIIYVTHSNLENAKKMADHLLSMKLVACVNYMPIESAYWWGGKIETSDEIVSLLKTSAKNWDKLKKEIEKIHPYETPCIMKFSVEANDAYEQWVEAESGN